MTNISIYLRFNRTIIIELSDKATAEDILKSLKKFFLRLDRKEFGYFFDPKDTTWNTDGTFYMSRRLERTGIKQYFADGEQYENWFKEVTSEKAQRLTLKEKITAFFSKSLKAEKQEERFGLDIHQSTAFEVLANPEQAHIVQRDFVLEDSLCSVMDSSTKTLPGLAPSDSTFSAMASSTRTLAGFVPIGNPLSEITSSNSSTLSEDLPNSSSASAIPSSRPIFFKPKTDSVASSLQAFDTHQL